MATTTETPQRPSWSSRIGFIFAATGSAVGLGNIWKFPYIAGENGGGAFVLVYLICLALLGVPLLFAELKIGQIGGPQPSTAFGRIAHSRGKNRRWRYLGHVGAFTALLLLSFYAVVTGWIGIYALRYAGILIGTAPPISDTGASFGALVAAPGMQIAAFLATLVAAFLCVSARGVEGIERVMRWLAPGFALLFGGLLIWQAVLGGQLFAVLDYLFVPRIGALGLDGIAAALGQAFFTLSVGICGMLVYGAYLPASAPIPRLAVSIAIIDTIVALVAAIIIFSIAFGSDIEVGAGPGLLFVTLPAAFQDSGGALAGLALFTAIYFAAFSSVVAILLVVARGAQALFDLEERRGAIFASLALIPIGLMVILSASGHLPAAIDAAIRATGNDSLQGLLDRAVSNALLPLSGIGLAIFAASVLGREQPETRAEALFILSLRYAAPVFLVLVAAANIF